MTNVSKNLLFAFAIVVSATVLSLGAFVTTAHASEWFDGGSYDGGGWSDGGSFDGGWYNGGSYDAGWYDGGSYNPGYYETDTYNPGWYETDTYNPGYYETDTYNPGYYETDTYNPGWYETDTYNPGWYETDTYNPGYYQTDTYNPGYVESYMQQYSQGSASGKGFTTGGGYSMPKTTPSYTPGCTNCHSYTPKYPTNPGCTHNCNPKPTTPGCTSCGGGSNTNITNTHINNTNTNTIIDNSIVDNSVNIVDNSINGSFNNSGNTTILAAVIPQQQIVYTQPHVAPYCVITLTNAGAYSATATLVWSSSNATSAYISQVGSVAPNGTRVVTGYANQVYSLTVTGQGGSYTCNTQPFTPTYVPPTITPSVSLSQIPYTGLALGPVAQALYWLSLFSVAAAGAYLLVYFKGGSAVLAGAFASARKDHFVVSEQEAAEEVTPVAVETEEVPPATNILNFLPALAETKTQDAMQMVRNATGMPSIVISRA